MSLQGPLLRQVRISRKELIAVDIALFELVSTDATHLAAFSAGAHIDVYLPGGMSRQYSLCNSPEESHRYHIAVLRNAGGRGGSRFMHDDLQVGDVITISNPKNHFPLSQDAKVSLLLAGGIGITPLLSMATWLSAFDHPIELRYCARSPERAAFLDQILQSQFGRQAKFHFDDGPAEQHLDMDQLLRAPSRGLHLYTCGPKGFMDAVLSKARLNGWAEEQLHYEFFGADHSKSDASGDFEVQLQSTGQVIKIAAEQTVTSALASLGIHIPVSCEQGVCGTCLTRVLDGTPDHRDSYLTPDEQANNDQFLPCCSRSHSPRLLLDL